MKKPFCMVSVGYMLNVIYYIGIHTVEWYFMGLKYSKVLDVGKIAGTKVKVERERERKQRGILFKHAAKV